MDLVLLVLGLALIGFFVWVLTTKIPMPDYWKVMIQILAVVVAVLYLTRFFHLPNLLR